MVGERVNREVTNFHLLRWHATKVVKVVVCARTRILLSLKYQTKITRAVDQEGLRVCFGYESFSSRIKPIFRPILQFMPFLLLF